MYNREESNNEQDTNCNAVKTINITSWLEIKKRVFEKSEIQNSLSVLVNKKQTQTQDEGHVGDEERRIMMEKMD